MINDQPTILFVDDELSILKSLRRLFMDEDWQMLFASSGNEGLETLKTEKVDLVVSDVRMPGMDGVEFLNRVKDLYPGIVRIFLSGYAEKKSVSSALAQGCAQQILPKPWNESELREVICAALDQSRKQQRGQRSLQTVINSLSNLPPLPSVYQDLRDCLADHKNFTIDQVVEIVRGDAAMSIDLLHWANSALFGQRRKVDTVKRAVVLLGIDVVESLVLSEAITRTIGALTKQTSGFDSRDLQRHSMGCAIIARLLAETFSASQPELADRVFIAGLLHDIGLLAEAGLFAEQFAKVQETAAAKKLLLVEAESEVLQTSHPEIGAILAEWWSLPSFIVNAIRWHLEPQNAREDKKIVEKVAVANILVTEFGIGVSGDHRIPEIEQSLRDRYRLMPEQLEQIKREFEENLNLIN